VELGTKYIPEKRDINAIINEPIMYGFKILTTEIPDEYNAIISEFEDNFEVNHVIAKKRNNGSKLEEKYILKL
tara:strand:+ start:806 stop:1024 length:219 start_codon:yes stop_codon:yes gene_type:complete